MSTWTQLHPGVAGSYLAQDANSGSRGSNSSWLVRQFFGHTNGFGEKARNVVSDEKDCFVVVSERNSWELGTKHSISTESLIGPSRTCWHLGWDQIIPGHHKPIQ